MKVSEPSLERPSGRHSTPVESINTNYNNEFSDLDALENPLYLLLQAMNISTAIVVATAIVFVVVIRLKKILMQAKVILLFP
jgi:hypothetical protein